AGAVEAGIGRAQRGLHTKSAGNASGAAVPGLPWRQTEPRDILHRRARYT
ncbi:unnamed protein product, partial [Ectocarpus fasciculatus]